MQGGESHSIELGFDVLHLSVYKYTTKSGDIKFMPFERVL